MMTKTIFAILTTFQEKKKKRFKKRKKNLGLEKWEGEGDKKERKQKREKMRIQSFSAFLHSLLHETIYVGRNVILPLFLS